MAQVRSGLSIEEKIRRVRDAYDAFGRGDMEGAKQFYSDDTVFHSQLRQRDFRGKEAIFAEMSKQQQERKLQLNVHDICASAEHAVALLDMSSETDGKPTSDRIVHVLHMDDDGKIKEVWALFNPEA